MQSEFTYKFINETFERCFAFFRPLRPNAIFYPRKAFYAALLFSAPCLSVPARPSRREIGTKVRDIIPHPRFG